MKVVMLGAPGAGKGTQAKRLAAKYNLPHISTGDIFRANIKEGTELGFKAKEYMDRGSLVPDEITIGMLIDRISADDCSKGYILDGFPRNLNQAKNLSKALEEIGTDIDYAIDVDVPDENIIERMSGRRACLNCGTTYHIEYLKSKVEGICDHCSTELVIREDDKAETVKNRLLIYHEQTAPLLEYYDNKGILKKVDGTLEINKVFEAIVNSLGE